MAGSLSAEQIQSYRERGYVSPLRVMAAAEAAAALTQLRTARIELGSRLAEMPHLELPWTGTLVRHPLILDAVESVIGPDISCWGGQFFIKEAGDNTFVSWHQDGTYWGTHGQHFVTAWLALTPSVPENGCMRVVPRTQCSALPHRETFAADNLLSRGQEANIIVHAEDAMDVILQPGEMSLHHALIVHGSEPNRAGYPRIGFAIRYAPTVAHPRHGAAGHALPIRGITPRRGIDA
jgi:non-haem Fe2+, alpha-ketoglutarate-dependent halogenase